MFLYSVKMATFGLPRKTRVGNIWNHSEKSFQHLLLMLEAAQIGCNFISF